MNGEAVWGDNWKFLVRCLLPNLRSELKLVYLLQSRTANEVKTMWTESCEFELMKQLCNRLQVTGSDFYTYVLTLHEATKFEVTWRT